MGWEQEERYRAGKYGGKSFGPWSMSCSIMFSITTCPQSFFFSFFSYKCRDRNNKGYFSTPLHQLIQKVRDGIDECVEGWTTCDKAGCGGQVCCSSGSYDCCLGLFTSRLFYQQKASIIFIIQIESSPLSALLQVFSLHFSFILCLLFSMLY